MKNFVLILFSLVFLFSCNTNTPVEKFEGKWINSDFFIKISIRSTGEHVQVTSNSSQSFIGKISSNCIKFNSPDLKENMQKICLDDAGLIWGDVLLERSDAQ